MTDDDARIAHLMGEPSALDDPERRELDDLAGLLADPSVWAAPPEGLEDQVVEAIRSEAAAGGVAAGSSRSGAGVVDLAARRAARSRRLVPALLSAAAAVIIVAAAVTVSSGDDATARFDAALTAAGAPGPSGSATLTRTDAGWEVVLDVDGLPRLDAGRYYQAWLRNRAGILVPLGSFNEGGRVTLWSGVSPLDYPEVTVTAEAADGNQASSGVRVLAGTAREAGD